MVKRVRGGAPAAIWTLAGIFVGIEILLQLLGPEVRFDVAYRLFAFFDWRLEAALGGQTPTPALFWSFFTHAFLHGGLAHLGMNTVIFLALGAHLARAVGTPATLWLFFGTAAAGALTFGLIVGPELRYVPMVGASGGLFGFLGAMKRWEWRYVSANALPTRRFWSTMLALVLINVLLSLGLGLEGGGVAWEAHLGGFVAGWLAGGALTPRRGTAIGPI